MDASLLESARDRAPARRGLSLVIPAYNEQECIEQALDEATAAFTELGLDYEILVVDDGSRDRTAELVEQAAAANDRIRLLRQKANAGYGAALRRGFAEARGDLVAFTDADCQFDLRQIDRLLMLSRSCDLACGYRIDRQDAWPRLVYSKAFNLLCRLLLGTKVRDCDCALKVFSRELVASLDLKSNGFLINAELLCRAALRGKSIVEVGVSHRPRPRGNSTVSPLHAIPVAVGLLRFWWSEVLFPFSRADTQSRPGTTLAATEAPSRPWGLANVALATLVLLAAAVGLLAPNLNYPLFEPDETRYAQIAREMLDSGDWRTPTLMGKPYLDKPPLVYWLTAASYAAFGEAPWTARLPCAVSALIAVVAAFLLGRRVLGDAAAWFGALALLLCGGFLLCGRFLVLDGPLTCLVTLSMLAAMLALRQQQLSWRWWIASAVACGLALLTKGPVALVLCLPPLVAWSFLTAGPAHLRGWRFLWRWIAYGGVSVAVALPWFVLVASDRPEFGGHFLWKHHLLRYVQAFDHQQPWWFYAPVLAIGGLPLSPLFPFLAKFLFACDGASRLRRQPMHGFLLLWAAWVLLFFSLSSCKLPTYILPALPPLALLCGGMLASINAETAHESQRARMLREIPWLGAKIGLATCAVAAGVTACLFADRALDRILSWIIAGAAAVAFAVAVRLPRPSWRWAWRWAVVSAFGALAVGILHLAPELAARRSVQFAAARFHDEKLPPGTPILYVGRHPHAAWMSSPEANLRMMNARQSDEIAALVARSGQVMIVTRNEVALDLRKTLKGRVELERVVEGKAVFVAHSLDDADSQIGSLGQRPRR